MAATWAPPVPKFEGRDGSMNPSPQAGIHSHADYLIHDHPFATLITPHSPEPLLTHLPLLHVADREPHGTL